MKTQIEKIADQLKAISPNISRADRKAIKEKHGFERSTVSNYINGRGVDPDTGLTMLNFFKGRIADREHQISQSLPTTT